MAKVFSAMTLVVALLSVATPAEAAQATRVFCMDAPAAAGAPESPLRMQEPENAACVSYCLVWEDGEVRPDAKITIGSYYLFWIPGVGASTEDDNVAGYGPGNVKTGYAPGC